MLSGHILVSATFCCLAVYARYGFRKEVCPADDVLVESSFDFDFVYSNQPLFVNFLPKTDENAIIDNICLTFFPLPDDPKTYTCYFSTVFCDGSTRVESAILREIQPGKFRGSNPSCTYTSNIIGFAGCDTYLDYKCFEYGECDDSTYLQGLSTICRPVGLSCLKKLEEIVSDLHMPEAEYFILPMQLPNQCVTEQSCANNIEFNFFRALNIPAPIPPPIPPHLPPPPPPPYNPAGEYFHPVPPMPPPYYFPYPQYYV
ncbi:hypothetical protein J6590_065537 [Homalodisca vitripennis]|nr:hypothetical protein J6590_065537 [Homalodisca vitripennis]